MTVVQAEPTVTLEVPGIPGEVMDLLDRLGTRYEVVDGLVVVMPSARKLHERLVVRMASLLETQASPELEVLGSNYNYYYAWPRGSFLNPDLLVARGEDADDDGIRVPPLLVVEVRSPSSERYDGVTKRDIYQRAGVPSYWLVDPDEPSLTVLELDEGGRYAETARVSGAEVLRVERPFPVELRLSR